MKNRFSNRETLNLQVGGAGGAGNVNPLQPNGEIKEAPGVVGIRIINGVMAGIVPSPSQAAGDAARFFATKA